MIKPEESSGVFPDPTPVTQQIISLRNELVNIESSGSMPRAVWRGLNSKLDTITNKFIKKMDTFKSEKSAISTIEKTKLVLDKFSRRLDSLKRLPPARISGDDIDMDAVKTYKPEKFIPRSVNNIMRMNPFDVFGSKEQKQRLLESRNTFDDMARLDVISVLPETTDMAYIASEIETLSKVTDEQKRDFSAGMEHSIFQQLSDKILDLTTDDTDEPDSSDVQDLLLMFE